MLIARLSPDIIPLTSAVSPCCDVISEV